MALSGNAIPIAILLMLHWCFANGLAWDALKTIRGEDYDALLPPPHMGNPDPLVVSFGMSIKSMDYDIMTAHLLIDYWIRLAWLDERLYYDGNTIFGANFDPEKSYIPMNIVNGDNPHIWNPDIMCFNATDAEIQKVAPVHAYLYSKQHVTAERPFNVLLIQSARMNAYCKPHLEEFPFDSQVCNLHFASWASNTNLIKMSLMKGGFQRTLEAPDSNEYRWTGNPMPTISETKYTATGAAGWSQAVVSIHMQRLPRYFLLNAVLPMFMMVVLSNLAFWIPYSPLYSGSGERMSYSITCLLTIVAVGLFTAEKRPMIGTTTWLDRWISTCLLFTSVPILETIFVFFLDAVFQNMLDAAGGEEDEEGRRNENSYTKYAEVVKKSRLADQRKSKKIMKVIVVVHQCVSCCPSLNPRGIDKWCRHVFPVLSIGRLLWLLNEVSDTWEHWTVYDAQAFYTIFLPFFMISILLFALGLFWLMITQCAPNKVLQECGLADEVSESGSVDNISFGDEASDDEMLPKYKREG